jgi:enoyl-CoA hydratase
MAYETIEYETKGHVAYLTLNRPKQMNSMNPKMKQELSAICDKLSEDAEIWGVMITGAGRAFSSGTDITTFPETGEQARAVARYSQELFRRVAELPQVTIAVVNGFALGGGFELSLACDFRIAAESAKFGFAEGKIGAIPCYSGTQRLTRLVGPAIAKDLVFTARNVSGQEAKDLGIIKDFTPDGQEMEKAEELMAQIMKNAPMSVKYSKMCINHGAEMPLDYAVELEADLVGILNSTHDLKEGAASFMEKRKPVFENR